MVDADGNLRPKATFVLPQVSCLCSACNTWRKAEAAAPLVDHVVPPLPTAARWMARCASRVPIGWDSNGKTSIVRTMRHRSRNIHLVFDRLHTHTRTPRAMHRLDSSVGTGLSCRQSPEQLRKGP